MEEEVIPADKLVAVYRRIRSAIEDLETEHAKEITTLKEKLELDYGLVHYVQFHQGK
jgi:hypothetical protein